MGRGISDVNSEEYKALDRKAKWEEITQLRDSARSWIHAIDRLKAYGSCILFLLGLGVPFRLLGEEYLIQGLVLAFVLSIAWYIWIPRFCREQSRKANAYADWKEKKFREKFPE